MDNFTKKILKKIEKESVSQKPAWYFWALEGGKYAFFFFSVLFGALSFAVILHFLIDSDAFLTPLLPGNIWEAIFLFLPIIWILSLLGFLGGALFFFRHAGRGYRIPLLKILLGNIVGSICIGYGMYAFGMGESIDTIFAENLPLYRGIEDRKYQFWAHPERGVLAGELLSFDHSHGQLKDFQGEMWTLVFHEEIEEGEKMILVPRNVIKIAGEHEKDHIFLVKKVLPWKPGKPQCLLEENGEDLPPEMKCGPRHPHIPGERQQMNRGVE